MSALAQGIVFFISCLIPTQSWLSILKQPCLDIRKQESINAKPCAAFNKLAGHTLTWNMLPAANPTPMTPRALLWLLGLFRGVLVVELEARLPRLPSSDISALGAFPVSWFDLLIAASLCTELDRLNPTRRGNRTDEGWPG